MALPGSKLGVGAIRSATRLIASRPVRTVKGVLPHGKGEPAPSRLPDYGPLTGISATPREARAPL